MENTTIGTVIGTLSATDDAGTVFTWSIQSASSASYPFILDPSTGEITISDSVNYEEESTYTFLVQVADNGVPVKTDMAYLYISILDTNEAPVLASDSDTTYLGAEVSIGYVIDTLYAKDPEGNSVSYSFASGNEENYFEIGSSKGIVTLSATPAAGVYNLVVAASDGLLSATSTVTVSVSSQLYTDKGTFSDSRDNLVYAWVNINGQIWMQENLNYDILDGSGSWCYQNSAEYCSTYGRLYTW
ncbi:MAG TPA: cadherin domain-containing protein, partial [Fibrobacteraceae bacterium]|nr:cadherin domain-containing protein [Fibrobacteraceae bacterium]